MPVGTEIYKRDLEALKEQHKKETEQKLFTLRLEAILKLHEMMLQAPRFAGMPVKEVYAIATRAWDGEFDLEKAP